MQQKRVNMATYFYFLHNLTMQHIHLPPLSPSELTHTQNLTKHIIRYINANNGAISFAQFMQLALYTPQFGYYTGGAQKIGAAGDFITAPTLSPLFAQTLAQQLTEVLPQTAGNIYEFGAGTGQLASDLLHTLSVSGCLKNYYIIELSSELMKRQRDHILQYAPEFANHVIWLTSLPEHFDGVILGNEVLDAMPVERIRRTQHGDWQRAYVGVEKNQFILNFNEIDDNDLFKAAMQYYPDALPYSYTSELHLTQHAFIQTLAEKLICGAMIWIDYGFDAKQYYHPQRANGTLIGHHRHHSIHDPFFRVGLTDLTAHINFSDIAEAAVCHGLDLIGYTTQAHFLFNLGLLDLLANQFAHTDTPAYIQAAHAVQQLTAQHEMGELFKVMALGKNVNVDWQGFALGDMCHKL